MSTITPRASAAAPEASAALATYAAHYACDVVLRNGPPRGRVALATQSGALGRARVE